jgi:hypothetical protein
MRHRDQETAALALEDWKRLRAKVTEAGGENYEKPVLVKFLDTRTYEVMDRDIVEDEFYVLRQWKLIRELDAEGKDLEEAIQQERKRDGQRGKGKGKGRSRSGSKSSGSKSSGSKRKRSGRRRGKRGGRRGSRGKKTGKQDKS